MQPQAEITSPRLSAVVWCVRNRILGLHSNTQIYTCAFAWRWLSFAKRVRLLSHICARPLVRALTRARICASVRLRMRSNAVYSHVSMFLYVCVYMAKYKVTAGAEAATTTSTRCGEKNCRGEGREREKGWSQRRRRKRQRCGLSLSPARYAYLT